MQPLWLWALHHGLHALLTVVPPLLLLAQAVTWIARRRGLPADPVRAGNVFTAATVIVVAAAAAQLLYQGFVSFSLPAWVARTAGLALFALLTASAAGQIVPYFCPWKGALSGLIAAPLAATLYQQTLPDSEGYARTLVSFVVVALLSMAVTLPAPEEAGAPFLYRSMPAPVPATAVTGTVQTFNTRLPSGPRCPDPASIHLTQRLPPPQPAMTQSTAHRTEKRTRL
ncbi:MAG: hypothetical protein NZ557_05645 [Chthonomonadaceae bacterium]|nr:hypothetical protein [Chthonomonadaceae bacterium]